MSELTLTVIRLGLLALLWIFVFSVVGVLRGDLYGTRVVSRSAKKGSRSAVPPRTPGPPTPPQPTKTPTPKMPRGAAKRVPTALAVTEGPLAGSTLPLQASGVLLGRNPECTLVLDDDFASGRHARIFQRPEGWYVEDLGSTNGTYLGSTRLTDPVLVEVGATLRIGKTVLELRK
jgi:pSer/pThr/pTyr-binding forkhead associated (FHA) protein